LGLVALPFAGAVEGPPIGPPRPCAGDLPGGAPSGGVAIGGRAAGGSEAGGGGANGGRATGGGGGIFSVRASLPSTLEEPVEEAPEGRSAAVGPEPVAANVTVGHQRATRAGDDIRGLTRLRRADPNRRALAAGTGPDPTVEGCVSEDCAGTTGRRAGAAPPWCSLPPGSSCAAASSETCGNTGARRSAAG